MDIQPIRTESDYKAALRQISTLMESDPEPGTSEGDRRDILTTLVQAYEARQFPSWQPSGGLARGTCAAVGNLAKGPSGTRCVSGGNGQKNPNRIRVGI